MSSSVWQGANQVAARQKNKNASSSSPERRQRPTETVEAALNRLHKAYNSAMHCVGAWHRADAALSQQQQPQQQQQQNNNSEVLLRVGRVARQTFETAVLRDALIAEHAPAYSSTTAAATSSSTKNTAAVVQLRSAGHKATVRQLAYLSLVNYADLLLAGLGSNPTTAAAATSTILDRGVVKSLKSLQQSCWIGNGQPKEELNNEDDPMDVEESSESTSLVEPEATTVRLAVVAYLDATALDGSDPTVWLKLACATRRLANASGSNNNNKYRRLEQHALERAVTARPRHEPPHQTAVRALHEWRLEAQQQQQSLSYPAVLEPEPIPETLVLELPRYSWSTFGRMLLRACKEGSAYTATPTSLRQDTTTKTMSSGAKSSSTLPNIELRLSPLLVVPNSVLAVVCSYLEAHEIWRCEATCRAMAANLVAARAILASDLDASQRILRRSREQQQNVSPPEQQTATTTTTTGSNDDPLLGRTSSIQASSPQPSGSATEGEVGGGDNSERSSYSKRVSKRVRSQLITSGKRTERSWRRNSTEYCLLAAVLGCTTNDPVYKQLVAQEQWTEWGNLQSSSGEAEKLTTTTSDGNGPNIAAVTTKPSSDEKAASTDREIALKRLSDSSLSTFVQSIRSIGGAISPLGCLFRFMAHTSLYIADVFSSDPGGSVIMSNCLLDCFDLMTSRTKLRQELISSWSMASQKIPKDSRLDRIEIFAIDLLNAELRLKKCGIEEIVDFNFDGDGNFVSMVVPHLLSLLSKLDKDVEDGVIESSSWACLKARCYWLAANFYFWRGRISSNVGESRVAEKEGLEYIEAIQQCLLESESIPISGIRTPHLETTMRKGYYWKELSAASLSAISEEIEASSILLLAQEQFLDATSKLVASGADSKLVEVDCNTLFSIGSSLLERYEDSDDSPAVKCSELIDDFIVVYGDELLLKSYEERTEADELVDTTLRVWFDGILPSGKVETVGSVRLSNPCILSILTTCLKTKTGTTVSVVRLLLQLVSSLVESAEVLSLLLQEKRQDACRKEDDFSDEDSLMSEDSLEMEDDLEPVNADRTRLQQYAILMQLILDKTRIMFQNELSKSEQASMAGSDDFGSALSGSLKFVAVWYSFSGLSISDGYSSSEDLRVFRSVQPLFQAAFDSLECKSTSQRVARIYLAGLIRIIVSQKWTLSAPSSRKGKSKGRTDRVKAARTRADLLASTCCRISLLLSDHPFDVVSGKMERSALFFDPDSNEPLDSLLAMLCDSLLWLWKAAESNDTAADKTSGAVGHSKSYLDRFGRERLRVPVAAAIVGLCGSAPSTVCTLEKRRESPVTDSDDRLSLIEFYDSDASATEWLADDEVDTGSVGKDKKHEELLRVILQAVHCVNSVFVIDEKEVLDFSYVADYGTENGPTLPLVVSRVLNKLAFHLLVDFAEDESSKALWVDYPFGTRTIGALLDSMLYKAYKYLHGFTLTATGETKESATSATSSSVSKKTSYFKPENTKAAAALYRCIMRAYGLGKKSPPKAALDTVDDALPAMKESNKSRALQRYLFSTNLSNVSLAGIVSLVTKQPTWEANFEGMNGLDLGATDQDDHVSFEDEVMVVRRGLAKLLAQGALPQYQDTGNENDIRSSSAQTEDELSKKFFAVIDNLCFGDSSDCDEWYKASQCLNMKADLIADRLGLSKGFARNKNFSAAERKGLDDQHSLTLADLTSLQEQETLLKDEGWTQCLGRDLSVYVRYSWSSFSALKVCAAEVGKAYNTILEMDDDDDEEDLEMRFGARIWDEINNLFLKDDFVGWQEAWGGLFVSSLRKAAHRCLSLALYMTYKDEVPDKLLESEITEAFGVNLYTELMGSQMYGYPMHEMTQLRKREIALAALACFERAALVSKVSEGDEQMSDSARIVWDLSFMAGKCHEKIANTYQREAFTRDKFVAERNESRTIRIYERHMSIAFKSYADSVSQAKEAEENGEFIAEQNGGSAHGAVEAVYRLHASRLKCLIAAVDRNEHERGLAEHEALRLTECNWFAKQDDENTNLTVRERVWKVLVDVVDALARCRLDYSYFHRSVYRHAQALMWAPVLYDPVGESAKGSLGSVSATWACRIRGLNYATNAANSAVAIIGTLFDRKRSQLCAVWVTGSGATSSFETINTSVRKYDSLRGKYISAYLESLRLCQRRKELETFLRWTSSSLRDLPSYFAASAIVQGGKPKHSHTNDSLLLKRRSLSSYHFLTTAKRQANSALANVVLQELNSSDGKKDAEGRALQILLKLAYACYLRLKCDPKALTKHRALKFHRKMGVKDIVEALTTACLKFDKDLARSKAPSDWSGESQLSSLFESSLQKCKEVFPTLTSNFYFSRRRAPKDSADKPTTNTKRKDVPEQVKRSFEVTVPEGLTEGETFLTSIQVGETLKKVRLTVPAGEVSTLRFTLEVPAEEGESPEQPSKKAREDKEDDTG